MAPGTAAAVAEVSRIAKADFGARMVLPLAVSGAFHTELMEPAVAPLAEVSSHKAGPAHEAASFWCRSLSSDAGTDFS